MSWRTLALVALAVVLWGPPSYADVRADAKVQVEFGIAVARYGLWREAVYRFERAITIDPGYAAAYNNLAVAYEHEGSIDRARATYEKALALKPKDALIRQNYDLFREIHERADVGKDRQR